MKRLFILVTSALLAATFTAACGQRGPLVLPPPEARQTPKPTPLPTQAPTDKPKQ